MKRYVRVESTSPGTEHAVLARVKIDVFFSDPIVLVGIGSVEPGQVDVFATFN
jgi:hypothetical protein